MADLNYLRTILANGGADLPTLNAIRALLDQGQVSDQDLSQMPMRGSFGGASGDFSPQPAPQAQPQAEPPPVNALAQALDTGDQPSRYAEQISRPQAPADYPDQVSRAGGRIPGPAPEGPAPLPFNYMRFDNGPEQGRVVDLDKAIAEIRAHEGTNTPNGVSGGVMKVIGTGGGSRVNLPDEQAPAQVNLDYSRPALEIGGAKAVYSKDEPGVAYVMKNGVPVSKVILGYDQQGSMQLNKFNQDMAKGQADIAHTQEQIRASRVNNPDMGSMNAGPTLSGDALLQSLDPGTAGLVKAYAEGRMAFPGGAAMRSPRMMQLLSLVSAYDPNFDAKDFNTRNKAQIAFTSGKQGDAVRAADQAIAHAGALSDDIDKLNNFNGLATPLNSIVNPVESAFGDPRQGRFKQNALALSAELRKVFAGGGGGSLAELQSWESGLPLNASQEQQRQYLAKGMDLLQGGINALNDQYQRAMGPRANIRDILSPTAQAALAKMETGQPQEKGASPSNIPPKAIAFLRQNPNSRMDFDRKYGQGAAAQVLGS
jgi:hypothetical protein